MKHLIPFISGKVAANNHRHQVNYFDSGAVMIDISVGTRFWVIQIDENIIGLSEVTDDTGIFDIIPDTTFTSEDDFKNAFLNIFGVTPTRDTPPTSYPNKPA